MMHVSVCGRAWDVHKTCVGCAWDGEVPLSHVLKVWNDAALTRCVGKERYLGTILEKRKGEWLNVLDIERIH